jgi:hypothetical protein
VHFGLQTFYKNVAHTNNRYNKSPVRLILTRLVGFLIFYSCSLAMKKSIEKGRNMMRRCVYFQNILTKSERKELDLQSESTTREGREMWTATGKASEVLGNL